MNESTPKYPSVTYSEVYDTARRWQWQECRDMAESCLAEARERPEWADADPDERREILTEIVDESTDGCGVVIYTGQALAYCFASSNDGAYEEATGEDTADASVRACFALRADVWEVLGDDWETDEVVGE